MKTSIIVLIAVSIISVTIITLVFLSNQEVERMVNNLTPYEKLELYKKELEKINQYNKRILADLERQIAESDDVHLEQLKKEISVLKKVIDNNKKELEQVLQKLAEMEAEK